MDGPFDNMNWIVLNQLDDIPISNGHEKSVNIGSCAQHTVHSGFQTGTSKTCWNIDKILKSMFFILHDSSTRREVNTLPWGTVLNSLR